MRLPQRLPILALAFVASCSPLLDFRLDPSFDDEAAEGIVQAAREWNAVTNDSHKITFDGDSWYIEKKVPDGPWAGVTYRGDKRIVLDPSPNMPWRTLALHELGHALGLRHLCSSPRAMGEVVPNAPLCIPGVSLGVMDPITNSGAFTDADIHECREAGACG